MKTKIFKLILLSFITVSLFSCGDATDENKCLENVKKTFPNAKIYKSYDSKYDFIVIDSLSIKYVETMNLSNANVSDVMIFEPVK